MVMSYLVVIGEHSFAAEPGDHTMAFNSFVLMQLFNQINARKIHDEEDIWSDIFQWEKTRVFLLILGGEFVLQYLIVQHGGLVFNTLPLDLSEWAICVGFGVGSLVVRDMLTRIPRFYRHLYKRVQAIRD